MSVLANETDIQFATVYHKNVYFSSKNVRRTQLRSIRSQSMSIILSTEKKTIG